MRGGACPQPTAPPAAGGVSTRECNLRVEFARSVLPRAAGAVCHAPSVRCSVCVGCARERLRERERERLVSCVTVAYIALFSVTGRSRGSGVRPRRRHRDGRRDPMPSALVVGEVSIGSGSMRHPIDPLTVQRFWSSLSRASAPHGSARALHRRNSVSSMRRARQLHTNPLLHGTAGAELVRVCLRRGRQPRLGMAMHVEPSISAHHGVHLHCVAHSCSAPSMRVSLHVYPCWISLLLPSSLASAGAKKKGGKRACGFGTALISWYKASVPLKLNHVHEPVLCGRCGRAATAVAVFVTPTPRGAAGVSGGVARPRVAAAASLAAFDAACSVCCLLLRRPLVSPSQPPVREPPPAPCCRRRRLVHHHRRRPCYHTVDLAAVRYILAPPGCARGETRAVERGVRPCATAVRARSHAVGVARWLLFSRKPAFSPGKAKFFSGLAGADGQRDDIARPLPTSRRQKAK